MADGETPASPPLPKRGSYNINFDALDESSNPFAPKVKLGSSPPNRSGNTLSTSLGADDAIDPFKPKKKLASSPPGSPRIIKPLNNNNIGDDGPYPDTPTSISSETLDNSFSSPRSADDTQSVENTQITKKKRVVKKTKVQSKMKLPKTPKTEEDSKGDVLVPSLDESATTGDKDVTKVETTPPVKKLPCKKIKPQDHDSNPLNESTNNHKEDIISQVHDEEVPCESASEAMASSSEIDRQFVEEGDAELTLPTKDKAKLEEAAQEGNGDLGRFDRSPEVESKTPRQVIDSSPPTILRDHTNSQGESLAKPSSSPEGGKQSRSHDAVSTSPQGKSPDGRNTKHPAERALEAAQVDNSLKVLDSKNKSSSEEALFYDAYDYPPAATTNTKLGQKSSSEMERGPNHEHGGDTKGAVVQLVQVLRYSQSDWNKLKQDLELNFQASLLNKERDWSLMLAERDKKIASLEESNRKVKLTNEDMRMIVAEFEKTISQLQSEKEKSKTDSHKVLQNLESERDQAIEDLQSVETAFSDLHRRYEKSKSIIEGFKRNEEQLKQCVEDLQAKLKKSDLKLQALRSQAEEKLDKANEDIEKIKKSTKSDLVRQEAALKKAELRISGLEESLQRKEKENQELTAICDELIAKVGS